MNLYGFVGNDGVGKWDVLGLCNPGDIQNKKIESVIYSYGNPTDEDFATLFALAGALTMGPPPGPGSALEIMQEIIIIGMGNNRLNPLPTAGNAAGDIAKIYEYLMTLQGAMTDTFGGFIHVKVSYECCECCYLFTTCWEEKEYVYKYTNKKNNQPFKFEGSKAQRQKIVDEAKAEALKNAKCS